MNIERVKMLEKYHQDDPGDTFTIYALAMEWMPENASKSQHYLDILLQNHKDYLPAYYQAGRVYFSMGLKKKAIEIYETGITLAKTQKDNKTLEELTTACDAVKDENEVEGENE